MSEKKAATAPVSEERVEDAILKLLGIAGSMDFDLLPEPLDEQRELWRAAPGKIRAAVRVFREVSERGVAGRST